MKHLNGKYYVEDKTHIILQTANIILGEQKEPKKLRTQYQVIKYTIIGRIQKVINNEKDELEVKPYPKKKIKQKVENPKTQNLINATIARIVNLLLINKNFK